MIPARGPLPYRHTRPVPGSTRGRGAAGFATAEAAVVLPVLLVVLSLAVAVVAALGAQLRCVDAARDAARVAARGDTDAAAAAAAKAVAPPGAHVHVAHRGQQIEVRVEANLHLTRWLPPLRVAARTLAESEDRP